MTLLVGLLLPLWLGVALVGACGGLRPASTASARWLGALLAWPLGLGLTSALAFVWLALLRPLVGTAGEVALELGVCLGATAVWWRRRRTAAPWAAAAPGAGRPRALFTCLGGASIVVGAWRLAEGWRAATYRYPFGDWDALAIWNLKARFFFWPDAWTRAFSPEIAWSHPDYPLLLPAFYARTWVWLGETTWLVPALTGLLFLALLVAIVAVAVFRLRGGEQALVAGALASGVAYLGIGFNQYADIPLAVFFLAVNVLLLESARLPGSTTLPFLAGLAAGAMVWTKNEGWAMLAALVASELLVGWRRHTVSLRAALAFGAGVLPLGLTTIVFKLALAPANDLLVGVAWSTLADPGRLLVVAASLGRSFLQYGPFGLPLLPVLLGYTLVQGTAVPPEFRPWATSLAVRLPLVLAAYAGAFLLTPHPLEWHLATSLERLISQLVPSVILLAMSASRAPGARLDRPHAG